MKEKIRLLIDEDMNLRLAEALRRRNYDAVHIQEVGRKGKTDPEQLAYAASEGRCFVTFNVGDFVQLHSSSILSNSPHSGIIVVPRISLSEAVHLLSTFLERHKREDMINELRFLSATNF